MDLYQIGWASLSRLEVIDLHRIRSHCFLYSFNHCIHWYSFPRSNGRPFDNFFFKLWEEIPLQGLQRRVRTQRSLRNLSLRCCYTHYQRQCHFADSQYYSCKVAWWCQNETIRCSRITRLSLSLMRNFFLQTTLPTLIKFKTLDFLKIRVNIYIVLFINIVAKDSPWIQALFYIYNIVLNNTFSMILVIILLFNMTSLQSTRSNNDNYATALITLKKINIAACILQILGGPTLTLLLFEVLDYFEGDSIFRIIA